MRSVINKNKEIHIVLGGGCSFSRVDREAFSDERTFEEKPENNKRGNENVGRMTFWVGVAVSAEVLGQDRLAKATRRPGCWEQSE